MHIYCCTKRLNEIRDKRVAHGSTPTRGIRLNQMVEFSQCASHVVKRAIEEAYGADLY